jgi:hypothetical protein
VAAIGAKPTRAAPSAKLSAPLRRKITKPRAKPSSGALVIGNNNQVATNGGIVAGNISGSMRSQRLATRASTTPACGAYPRTTCGSFSSNLRYCRAACRDDSLPGVRGLSLGFRVVVSPSVSDPRSSGL